MKKFNNVFYNIGISIQKKFFSILKKITIFFIVLVSSIIIANSIIYFVQPIENKIIYTNWILLISSSIAVILSVMFVTIKLFKQKKSINI